MDKCIHIIPRDHAKRIGMKRFFTAMPCKHGHIDERSARNGVCVECLRLINKRSNDKSREKVNARRRQYYQENKKAISEKARIARAEQADWISFKRKKSYYDNHEKNLDRARQYRDKDREAFNARCKMHRDKAKERNVRKAVELARRKRQEGDPRYMMRLKMREMLRRVMRLTGNRKANSTFSAIGYTRDDLISHLEAQFVDGMSWENYGSEWHIDHIRPVINFIDNGICDPAIIHALDNLQPLWADENMRKSDKVDHLL